MGSPQNLRLIELGPGRGTMLIDAMRAAQVVPAFRAAIVLHLVEVNPKLRERQQQMLSTIDVPAMWHETFDEVPEGPAIILANEFFDALPVNQAIKQFNGWYERVVEVDSSDNLVFGIASEVIPLFDQLVPKAVRDAPVGAIYEWRTDNVALGIGTRVTREPGAEPTRGDAAGDPDASMRRAAQEFAERSGLRRDESGQLDVLSAMGGWRGVVESILPGLVYLTCVILVGELSVALTASLATAAVFTLARLAQRRGLRRLDVGDRGRRRNVEVRLGQRMRRQLARRTEPVDRRVYGNRLATPGLSLSPRLFTATRGLRIVATLVPAATPTTSRVLFAG